MNTIDKTTCKESLISLKTEFTYEGEEVPGLVTDRVDIKKGETVVLCGASGSGKTTFLRCISHMIPEFYPGNLTGFVIINGKDIQDREIGEVGEQVSYVFQDPRTQFFTLASDTEVAFGLENFGMPADLIRQRVDQAFTQFNLEHLRGRDVFKLSSGERQMIAIIAAWAADTDVILLDEPAANLDSEAVVQLAEMLKTLKEEGKTIVICEHRLYYLTKIADRYIYFEGGTIERIYGRDEFLNLTKEELYKKGLRITSLSQIKGVSRTKEKVNKSTNSVLTVSNLSFNYIRGRPVLKDVNFTAGTGSTLCLTGHNGCGKTTLGKCITGLLPVNSGEIKLDGQVLRGKDLSKNSIFIMQEAEFQFFSNSVKGEIQYGLGEDVKPELIEEMLKTMGLWEARYRHPFSLSGGQMQKLTLLLAYFSDRRIVILDEPTSGLDRKSLEAVVRLIDRMKDEKIVILISHDKELIGETEAICIPIGGEVENKEEKLNGRLKRTLLDPRVNLVAAMLTLIVTGIGNRETTMTFSAALVVLAIFNRQYKVGIISAGLLGTLYGAGYIHPSASTLFLSEFLPRYILIFITLAIILSGEGAANLLAGMRKIHVPEKAIMIMSVSFRFFPVLKNDLALMIQSVRSRGSRKDKGSVAKLVGAIETVTISMVFRVIRIAECLAASAETRGIALNRRRESYISLKMLKRDWSMIIILIISIGAGVLLHKKGI